MKALILAGLAEHWGSLDESLNPDLDNIATSHATGRTVVVEVDGQIIGTGTLRRSGVVAEIVRMSVASPHRRLGIGRIIVDALIDTARAWGATRVILETSTQWEEVVAFYLASGFSVTHHAEGDFGRDTWFERRL